MAIFLQQHRKARSLRHGAAAGKQQSTSKPFANANKGKGKAAVRPATRGGAPKVEEVKRRKMPLTGSQAAPTEDSDAEEDDEMDVDGEEEYEQKDQDFEFDQTKGQHGGGADAGGENKRLSKGETLHPSLRCGPHC